MKQTPHCSQCEQTARERDDARRWAGAWKRFARSLRSAERLVWKRIEQERLLARNEYQTFDAEIDELAAQVGALREVCQLIWAEVGMGSYLDFHLSAGNIPAKAEAALALDPPTALAELEARIRGEEQERISRRLLQISADLLFKALYRESPMHIDPLGFMLTADELRQVKKRLILAWTIEHLELTPTVTMKDYLEFTGALKVIE